MRGRRAVWAFVLAVPAALGLALGYAGLTGGDIALSVAGVLLVLLAFIGLNWLNRSA